MARALRILALAAALPLPGAGHATLLGMNPDPLVAGALQAELVGIVAGVPAGGVVLEGTIAAPDVTLVLRPTFLPSAFELTPVNAFAREANGVDEIVPTGGGTIPGAGRDVASLERSLTLGGVVLRFQFEPGIHPAGAEGDLIFASFPALADRDILWLGVSARRPGDPFGRADFASARLVPEPATPLLAALAAGLALRALRRVIG